MGRILVVEDDAAMRASIRRTIRGLGHDVLEAENGKKALSQIEQEAPHCIITDILMPEMEGLEFIKKIAQINPGLPVIAMSGSVETAYLLAAKKFGAVERLEKPFKPETLSTAIENALKMSKTIRD